MREQGFHDKLFDMLDERMLSKEELRGFFRILFGDGAMDGVADPDVDWDAFVNRVSELNSLEKKQWNPITHRMEHWINIKQLKRDYGPGWLSSMFG